MAAAPSGASSTSYPARSKAFRSIARSSFLSSTRRRGSISLVSTTNSAVVRELRVTSVQRREAAHLHDQADAAPSSEGSISAQFQVSELKDFPKILRLTTYNFISTTAPIPDRRAIFSVGLPSLQAPA